MITDATGLVILDDSGYSTTPAPEVVSEPKERNPITRKRISHRKSRTGCQACKDSKVKARSFLICDELRPSCLRCDRLQILCEYRRSRNHLSPDDSHTSPNAAVKREPTSSASPVIETRLNLLQLELLQTYATFTCTTMPWLPALKDFWRVTVPNLALNNDYLMSALLAIPALHLAHVRPERRGFYVSAALEYHQTASEAARVKLQNVSEHAGAPLLLFSALSVITGL
ncbi:Lysine biosynthesis regulatory protein LYS14 [Colletotrichum chlorophyti]|uniref:Lysine biosynthesis regulatory protein LYS14 n=1 Tax=Colletotrichum chlorophyti TaxID=708187 RepID=A0A1Q8RVL0_9PEZI|nr:Lysine biosynthesis regulatory protein LYS14 [Colletotrichum chlorophyti]